ncbi:acyl-CoA dehydrogenase [Sphingomonas paeninsulae]|jgi:alkylation response protein AidB-like acyl-CoA dehydrogenase|uniref:Acyl-CoA dehydrogenase n=1 Tax=Sphingomonas paeninsulae TaxID=2319844 RepID=A0A494TIC9_SPHPE|nr:acyl-CoA dehydrogenase family protein [Sphingomonas paeninsulae]AYJ87072.1 acyl-CoA dehydrogenase [Sphingomonas paeninsulae]
MALTLTDEQVAVRDAARDYLQENAGFEQLRRTVDGTAGWDEELWRGFASELGFAGAGIAEEDGGIGLGAIEQALILEELGRTLAPIPWFESVVLAGRAITATATADQRRKLLSGISTGETIATLAMLASSGVSAPDGVGPQIDLKDGQWVLAGEAHYVPFGHVATLLIVAARRPGTSGWDGLTLIALPVDTPGLSVKRVVSLDLTRPYTTVCFDNVTVDESQLLGAVGEAGPALHRTLIGAAGLLAAEQLGGATRSLEETVAYAKDRVQFGRTIGSFQAVKHRLADMKLLVDYARSASDWAARAIAEDGDFESAASGARSYCSDAFLTCASDAIQLHGGIGFTWEHHAHLFFKRARSSSTMLGSPAEHREAIARTIIDPAIDQPEHV